MDRLTRRIGDSLEFVDGKGYANLTLAEGQKLLFSRLAAYEDTGLSPDEIKELQSQADELKKYIEAIELLKEFAFYCIDESVEEHGKRAARVQEFLKTTSAKDWIEEQLRLTKCEFCETYDDCEKQDGSCKDEQKCRVCGCTWNNACEGGCYWVEPDLCSKCVDKE